MFNPRMVVFLIPAERTRRGLGIGAQVALETVATGGAGRRVEGSTVRPGRIPEGCRGASDPETNPLVPLSARDPQSETPSSKSIPIRIVPIAG
ncbi:hypothetical protein LRS73_32550 (plasmid) [Methylobacterium currus]|uniref:hypothetical protein n=1 Tax=Methylobacterium currus TaxID=2051553 RepID=UPI001E2E9582|nr:hypothetical protein [Methylobacterium currus]UHC20093.1 hypothetical protein LRS73_32550 [Methylobacterium currus]